MEITAFGLIFIPLFTYFFFRDVDKLFLSLIFFCQFTATSVINVNSITFGLQCSVFISILLIIYLFLFIFSSKGSQIRFGRSEKIILLSSSFFLLSVVFGFSLKGFNSNVSFFNFAQFVYLLFGFLTAFSVYLFLKINPNMINSAIKIYIYSGVFCALWAFYQLITILLGIDYIDFFNNSVSDAALKFDMTLGTGVSRVSSVAVEPSFLARTLASVLIMLITLIYLNPIKNRENFSFFYIILIFSAMVLTASSSAILSLLSIALIMFFFRPVILIVISFVFAITVNYLMFFNQAIYDSVINLTVNKIYTYSYYARMSTIEGAWFAFLDSPFFGDGWESHPAQDVFAKLLGNTGIVGTILFLFILVYPIYQSLKLSFTYNDTRRWLARSVSFSLIVVLFIDVFSSLSFVFSFMWVLLGMLFFISSNGLDDTEFER
jgi:hypothetical protein